MRVSKELILRQVAGESILVPIGQAALKIRGMLCLSPSAAFLFRQLQADCSEKGLVDALVREYDVDRPAAAADVCEFIDQLRRIGALE